jgi:Putative Ig domain/FG-GAP-like repeat/Cadherin-like domain
MTTQALVGRISACLITLLALPLVSAAQIVSAPGAGRAPSVRVVENDGTDRTIVAYDPAFVGGVRVAMGDINGDGVADIITGAGPGGGPHVRVWNGVNHTEIAGFFAYDPAFVGGISVAAGDVNGDGVPDIITGAGPGGGPHVRVWSGLDFVEIGGFFAYDPAFTGGVSVTAGDVNGDGRADIITGAGAGGGPHVRVWSGADFTEIGGFFAYDVAFAGGVDVAAGDVNGDGRADIITGAGPGGGPHVRVWDGATFVEIGGFFAFVPEFTGGVTVGAAQLTSDNRADIITGAGAGGGPFVVYWSGSDLSVLGAYYAYEPTFTGGVFVGTVAAGATVRFTSANSTTFTVGSAGTFAVTTAGGASPAITATGTLPAGVTFTDNGNGTATLAGTPSGPGGTFSLTLTATDPTLPAVVQSFTLTVNQVPAFTSASSTTFTIGTPGTFSVTTTGFPAAGLTAGGTLPGGVTFVDNLNGTGTLSGTPASGTSGAYPLTFTATNGVGSPAAQSFTLNIGCSAITLTPAAGALTDGSYLQAYSQMFTAAGGSGHTFTVTAGALPPGVTLAASGALTGSPTNTGSFSFTVTATDSALCTGAAAYTLAVAPNAVNEAFFNAVGNTQYVVSPTPTSATPAVLVTGTVLSNDAGPGALTAGPAGITSTNGGAVSMSANGAFVYTPVAGFAGPSDSFTYTLTDGNGRTDTATVTIDISGVVWFVNAASPANGDGRSHSPFNVTTNAEGPSLAGQIIYVHPGPGSPPSTGPTPGAIVLKANQTLQGAGAPFTFRGLSIPFGGFPTLAGTVTLANGVLVHSVRINSISGPAISGTGLTGTETLTNVNVLGGTSGILLTNVDGTINFNGAVTGLTTGPSLLVNGGTASMTGRLAITGTAGRSVDIQNKTGGSITLGGGISDAGTGILLNNNTATTINFTGGLTLNTGANAAFTATTGGTVNITQDNTTVVNTIATTTGTALNVTNTTIGSSGLTFRSIAANGAANAIVLNSTGTLGGLTVSGNGSVPSGGVIQNTTGPGILVTNASNLNLTSIVVQGSGDDGIRATDLTGFTLTGSAILDNGNAVTERGLEFTGLFGTANINTSIVSGSADDNLHVSNASGALTLTVGGTPATCQFTNTSAATGNDGIHILGEGTANMSVSVSNCAFNHNRGDHFQVATSAVNTAVMTVSFTTNTLIGDRGTAYSGTDLGGGIHISPAGDAQTTFNVLNNNIQGATATAIAINLIGSPLVASSATLIGTVSGNVIGSATTADSGSSQGDGISVISTGNGTTTIAVASNTVRQYSNLAGINIHQWNGNGTLNATVSANSIGFPGSFASHGILAQAGAVSADQGLVCANIGGPGANAITGSGANGGTDFRVRQRETTTVRLPGYAGAATDTAAVVAFIQGLNPGATGSATVNSPPGAGFVGGGACLQP